jgi:ubiquinone biosynthesis protein UbiJ
VASWSESRPGNSSPDGEDRFRVRIADGQLQLARGGADQPDATIQTDPGTLKALLQDGRQLAEAQGSGAIQIEGDRRVVARFLGLFPPPAPASAAEA